jgi:hypothetical protein
VISAVESAKLKVERAAVHVEEIHDILWDYLESEPSAITKYPDGDQQINFLQPPPPSVAIIGGEVLYQLRSAIDHLTFELVKRNSLNIQLPKQWERGCQFPLILDIPTKGNPPVPTQLPLAYNAFKDVLPGISKESFTFIESVQPYHGRDGTIGLRYLAELSNIDKHRYPHITKPHAMRRDVITAKYRGETFVASNFVRVDDGAKTGLPSAPNIEILNVQVEGAFTPFVSFDETALGINAPNLPVDHVLQSCLDAVEKIVIPAFSEFLK